MEKKNKKYITSSLPYANASPHIGHILDPLIADVVARFHTKKGDDVRFLVGTDEHGMKITRAAEKEGLDPQAFVNAHAKEYEEFWKLLNISFTDTIRTTDERHIRGAQKMWRELLKKNDLYKKIYKGLYCVGHEAFITEKDLKDGKCIDHQKEPEVIEEENWFFRLSNYTAPLSEALKKRELVILPESRRHEIESLLESGLEDISFSRPQKSLFWGVPVPDDPESVMYVWAEALVSYLSALGYGDESAPEGVEKWWPADLQVIGKDNLRFHAVIFPAMLMTLGLPIPRTLFVHGFVTVEGQKMSKTIGNVVSASELIKKYGEDPVRYFFLREFSPHEDGDFSEKKFIDRYNGDLANGIGNLVARVATLGEPVSPLENFETMIDLAFTKEIDLRTQAIDKYIQSIQLHDALTEIWKLVSFGDKYLNEKKPWELKGSAELIPVLANAGFLISTIADLLEPFIPETAANIRAQISIDSSTLKIKKGGNLFPRLG